MDYGVCFPTSLAGEPSSGRLAIMEPSHHYRSSRVSISGIESTNKLVNYYTSVKWDSAIWTEEGPIDSLRTVAVFAYSPPLIINIYACTQHPG